MTPNPQRKCPTCGHWEHQGDCGYCAKDEPCGGAQLPAENTCPTCEGKGKVLDFGYAPKVVPCWTCGGSGQLPPEGEKAGKRQHGQEGTHYACDERLKELGGQATCCGCTGHKCSDVELINVKDYGAVGDGVHDDTAAFVAAYAEGEKTAFTDLPEEEQAQLITQATEESMREQRALLDSVKPASTGELEQQVRELINWYECSHPTGIDSIAGKQTVENFLALIRSREEQARAEGQREGQIQLLEEYLQHTWCGEDDYQLRGRLKELTSNKQEGE